MGRFSEQLTLQWQDTDLSECTNFWTTQEQIAPILTPWTPLIDASKLLTVAGLQCAFLQRADPMLDPATTGPYQSVFDKLEVFLESASGRSGRITIPAPQGSIFL